jgi:ankyrin repeat protein
MALVRACLCLVIACAAGGCASLHPLEDALRHDDTPQALELIQQGRGLGERDYFDQTPLHLAAIGGDVDVAKALIGKGAAIEATNKAGRTPLYLAAENCHADVAALLLDDGAKVDAAGQWGNTPLMAACNPVKLRSTPEQTATVELLVRRGASVNAQNQYGLTALHAAARLADPTILNTLLAHGADVQLATQWGLRPVDAAVQSGRQDNAILLFDAGAAPQVIDKDAETSGRTYELAAQYMARKAQLAAAATDYQTAAGEFRVQAGRCKDDADQAAKRAANFGLWDNVAAHLGDGADTRAREYALRDQSLQEADKFRKLADECAAKAAALQTTH